MYGAESVTGRCQQRCPWQSPVGLSSFFYFDRDLRSDIMSFCVRCLVMTNPSCDDDDYSKPATGDRFCWFGEL